MKKMTPAAAETLTPYAATAEALIDLVLRHRGSEADLQEAVERRLADLADRCHQAGFATGQQYEVLAQATPETPPLRPDSFDRWATGPEETTPPGRERHIVQRGRRRSVCGATLANHAQWQPDLEKPQCPTCLTRYARRCITLGPGEVAHLVDEARTRLDGDCDVLATYCGQSTEGTEWAPAEPALSYVCARCNEARL